MLGLTLAMRMAKQGHDVTLIEAAPKLGGLAGVWQIGDVEFDKHYHVTLLSDSRLRNLVEEIGLQEDLTWVETKTGFGARGWYECPCCKRRVAILYANPHFACRTCHGLHYAIERESIRDRAIRTAIKHRRNFGLRSGGVIAPFPSKPHLMRWHTYFKARETDRSNLEKIAKCF